MSCKCESCINILKRIGEFTDTERLDWLIENNASVIVHDLFDDERECQMSYNDGCQIDRRRFKTPREAIDAAMKEQNEPTKNNRT